MQGLVLPYGKRDDDGRMRHGAWFTYPISDQWTAALRLIPQDGRPVIAELRIYPAEGFHGTKPGSWSENPDEVPVGGLASRVIRLVKTDVFFDDIQEILDYWRQRGLGDFLDRRGFTEPEAKPRRGRRPARTERQYAEIAALYAATLLENPRRTMQAVVPKLQEAGLARDAAEARSLVQGARRAGMLTKSTQGIPGGALTAKARRTLEEEAT